MVFEFPRRKEDGIPYSSVIKNFYFFIYVYDIQLVILYPLQQDDSSIINRYWCYPHGGAM